MIHNPLPNDVLLAAMSFYRPAVLRSTAHPLVALADVRPLNPRMVHRIPRRPEAGTRTLRCKAVLIASAVVSTCVSPSSLRPVVGQIAHLISLAARLVLVGAIPRLSDMSCVKFT